LDCANSIFIYIHLLWCIYVCLWKIWYSVAKALSEKEAWKFAALNSLDLVVVLPGFVVGPCLPDQLSKTAGDVLNLLKGMVTPHLTHVDDSHDSMMEINKAVVHEFFSLFYFFIFIFYFFTGS
jgi:nucleoside-diphosphate-sugar epimerase